MANKFFLVPEDMYRGLLATMTAVNNDDNLNLSFMQNKVDQLKKDKNLNISAKNILYNQELRRYLQMRKEAKEKPIKIELTNGAKLITTPENNNEAQVFLPENEEIAQISDSSFPLEASFDTDISAEGDKERQILDYIKKQPDNFGATAENKVIGPRGKEIKGSDIKTTVKKLTHPHAHHIYSPPGSSIFKKKLIKEPKIQKVLEKDSVVKKPVSKGGRKLHISSWKN